MGRQPFERDIVVGRDSRQQRLEHVCESVRDSPQRVIVAMSDAERLGERIEIGRRQRGNQNRCQLGGIEWSLFQANTFSRQDSQ